MGTLHRRGFLKVSGAALAGTFIATTTFLHIRNEADTPVVKPVLVKIPGLPTALDGFTIVQLSDIHLEPYTQPPLVQKAVDLVNQLNPDVAVLTGDYVWRWGESAFELTPILAGMKTRLGIYATMGNHDYWTDIKVVQAAFDQAGIPVLYNQGVALPANGHSVYLAGMDDGWVGQPDLSAALDGAPPGAPVVLLLHEPDLADQVAQDGRVTLQLAGHTHGGQVRIGGTRPVILPYLGKKYDLGLFNVNNMWLYTNGGLGVISIPLRINCPPDVTYITLTSG